MGLYVMNSTTLPVRVIAFLVKGEDGEDDHIVILLTLSVIKVPRPPLIDITLRKGIHPKTLVAGVNDGMRVKVIDRARLSTTWMKSKKGDRILCIRGAMN